MNSFYQTMLLRPCPTWSLMVHFFFMSFPFLLFYFFTTVKNWLRESTITFKYAQQATTTAHTFISSFCFDIFLLFWTFEQIWVGFDTLITVKKLPAGRHNHIDGRPQQQSDDNINFFFSFFSLFVTLSEEKWKKDDVHSKPQRQPIRIQNLDKRRRMFAHFFTFLHFSDFLSKIEQDWPGAPILFLVFRKFWAILSYFWAILSYFWAILSYSWAILSKIEQDLPGPTNTFFSIASIFEQNWAKLSRICRGPPILFLVLRAILSKIEQDLRGPTNIFFFVLGAFLSKLVKGQLGVPPTVVINLHK